jgi:hypothetical protein
VALVAFIALTFAFIAERAHQWQSLTARDWSFEWKRTRVPRAAFLATTLVICWGEGLGFYVQSDRAFWAMIFWIFFAHVVLTASLAIRGAPRPIRTFGPVFIALATLAAMRRTGVLEWDRPPSWFGQSLLPPWSGPAPAIVCGLAFAFSMALLLQKRWRGHPGCWFLVATTGAAFGSVSLPGDALGPLVFLIAGHAIPCFIRNLARVPAGRRTRAALVPILLAGVEWFVVAKSIWFPEGALFPDLGDWWDLGNGANFLLHPLWMAPFLAHVVIDAIRFVAPREPAP